MKQLILFLSIIVAVSVLTLSLMAFNRPKRSVDAEEKKYKVEMTLPKWSMVVNGFEYTKQQLRKSDLPARDVNFIIDSIITPHQNEISLQVNAQIKADSTKPVKKN